MQNPNASQPFSFFDDILTMTPGVIYVFDLETRTNDYSNHSVGDFIGMSPAEVEDLGDDFLPKTLHPDDLPRVFENFAKLQTLGDDEQTEVEYRMRHRDGYWVWVRSQDRVYLRTKTGQVAKIIGIATNISKSKQTELDLIESNKILETINKEVEELIYITHHDVKGPLNSIASLLGMLEEDLANGVADTSQLFDLIKGSIGTAGTKIKRIMDVADARNAKTNKGEPCDLSEIFAEATQSLAGQITASSARINTDFTAANMVNTDRTLLVSVFENLITNAMKYRKADQAPLIEISTQIMDQAVALTFRDHGLGLDLPRDEHSVFGLFKRAHEHVPGDGAALYLIKNALERIGGTITVDSELGVFTSFKVTLPSAPNIPTSKRPISL